MGSQVAVAEVAVVPTFKGFRAQVTKETERGARTGAQGFSRTFAKTGTDTGKTVGAGFKKAFEQSANGSSSKLTKQIESDVAKASRTLSAARLKEQDAIGKVRVAQAQLNEANRKYERDSSQVIRAQERLATASRQLKGAHENTERATDDLKRSQNELARSADNAADELADAGQRGISGFRSNVVGGVKSFAVPLIGAFAALGIGSIAADAFREARDFVLNSITMASDLEQSIGGVDAVFAEQAKTIHRWAETADQAVGLSQSSYNEFATIVGAQLKNLGIPLDDLSGQTNLLIELGADLAAQYGGPTSEAVSALSSLLRGERDPIERYGVTMNEAAVKAEAFSLGLVEATQDADKVAAAQLRAEVAQRAHNDAVEKYGENSSQALSANASLISANSALESALEGTTGELTAQQKAQATLSLLMKQTTDAQGAFARESDTLAGKQQRNSAAWENLTTQLGTSFLPVASQVADVLGKEIIPVISDLADEYGPELAGAFADILPDLTELAKELLPLLPDLFEAIIASLPSVIAVLRFLGPLFVSLAQDNGTWTTVLRAWLDLMSGTSSPQEFVDKILAMSGPLASVLQGAYDLGLGLHGLLQGVINFASAAPEYFDLFRNAVRAKLDEVIGFIQSLPERAIGALGDLGTVLFASGRALMDGFLAGINSILPRIGQTVSDALDWVTGFFPHSPAKRGPLSGAGWTRLRQSGEAYWDQWVGGMGDTGPTFPAFPGGAGAGSETSAGSSSGYGIPARGGASIVQTNNFDKTDPREGAELAANMLSAALRGAG